MSLTQVDINDEALAEAMQLMGTKTKKETINRALEEYAARTKRLQALRELAEMGARGDFDAAAEAHRAAKEAWKAAFAEEEQDA
ncbi:type II toxin-antitoxin system VapB family antitoxin [Glycomyces artemisiae]|uniref:Arc/MetJ family transcription regulator n=1 Tax=Glycomyces artemisiae TaxID=1076443 RepID=A0A2T0UKV0_9ACTN|nr:type II toxin-antitoxin system VapB family antitoxin [Glycomyces artemisiae]PRY58514.1 Arc/MetJ family transcription regulator [Glycomyces artemisiae]